ncbi:PhzF family phenazine biosynthesis protein [Leptospira alstonii]|nr:PhzF family phenazine biosynthesis protein [Leptospira alstonii]
MKLETFLINSFTDEIACGNPAGVVLLNEPISDILMQKIAFDINKSETAFVTINNSEYYIRWFSPLKEVSLCGHATLAASAVLFDKILEIKNITFNYCKGKLLISKDNESRISMIFPKDDYIQCNIEPDFLDFFNISKVEDCIIGINTKKVVLILNKEINFNSIKPDYNKMKNYIGICNNGIGISKVSNKYDVETRYFNPWYGVDEDPVTGSVHTLLGPYWSKILNKNKILAYQNSQRPGLLELEINKENIKLFGKAKIFLKGFIEI